MVFFKKNQSPSREQRRKDLESRNTSDELQQRYAFRRNRTITGSASSDVRSASESNVDIKSPRVKAHELTKKRRHIGLILLITLSCAGALFFLLSQFTATVQTRAVNNAAMTLDNRYKQEIENYLSERPIERFRFMLNVESLTDYLKRNTPEVQRVTAANSSLFATTLYELTMRKPTAGWNVDGSQHYVDTSGVAFKHNFFATPPVQVIDKNDVAIRDGRAVASNRFLSFVGKVIGLASSNNYTVEEVVIPSGTTRQVELHLKGIKYPIKMSIDRPAGEQIEDMVRATEWMAKQGIAPQYIDIRASGRAFYRD